MHSVWETVFKDLLHRPYPVRDCRGSPTIHDQYSSLGVRACCCCCCCKVASVVSDSVRPHGLLPTRLLHPWDSPGKNTGVGCHFLCMKVESESEVAQSCPTLSDPMDCSPPGSSVHGIFQATVLEWGAIAFSGVRAYFLTNDNHPPSLHPKSRLS